MGARYTIELLGGLRVIHGERTITRFGTQKAAALLAYLAFYADRHHHRDDLAERFWSDTDGSSRTNLRQALTALRRELEPEGTSSGAILETNRDQVRLRSDALTCDVAEFEAVLAAAGRADAEETRQDCLERAIRLYRGELLPGFGEHWILGERARLEEAALGALWQLTALSERKGDLAGALDYAKRAVATDPLREASHATVMQLYVAAGQPAAALRQYEELTRILEKERKTPSSPETRALARSLAATAEPVAASKATPNAPASPHYVALPPRSNSIPTQAVVAAPQESKARPRWKDWRLLLVPAACLAGFAWWTASRRTPSAPAPTPPPPKANASSPASTPSPSYTLAYKRMAFGSYRTGNSEIYTAWGNGTGLKLLAPHPKSDQWPAWSPDGKLLAFASERGGSYDIWLMRENGTGLKQLTTNPSEDIEPAWTPDGRIVFRSKRDGAPQIYIMDADGRNQMRLTHTTTWEYHPAVSLDGAQIAFVSMRDGHSEIYVMDVDGSHPTRITHTDEGVMNMHPAWSPDGKRLVFTSSRKEARLNLYLMNADGTSVIPLTSGLTEVAHPSWSSDGAWIIFSVSNGSVDIWAVRSDGTEQKPVIQNPAGEEYPSWRP